MSSLVPGAGKTIASKPKSLSIVPSPSYGIASNNNSVNSLAALLLTANSKALIFFIIPLFLDLILYLIVSFIVFYCFN